MHVSKHYSFACIEQDTINIKFLDLRATCTLAHGCFHIINVYTQYILIIILSMNKTREISMELDTYIEFTGWVSIGPRSISQIILLFFVYTKNCDIYPWKFSRTILYIPIALRDHLGFIDGFEFAAKKEQSVLAGWGILIILTTIAILSLWVSG